MKVVAKPIDVVVWFAKDGMPNPVKIRLLAEDKSEMVYKINKIVNVEKIKLAGNPTIVFTCQGEIKSVEKLFEIRYENLTCKWMLFKI
ncbi:hypothetical protein [Rhodopseudomonas parapalustris]